MASPASSNPNNKQAPKPLGTARHPKHWVIFVVCLLVGVLASVALLDYDPAQSVQTSTAVHMDSLVGFVGAEGSYWSFKLIGLSTWLLPVFLLWMAFTAIRNARLLAATRFIAMVVCIIAGSALADMFDSRPDAYFPYGLGGALGRASYDNFLEPLIGPVGSGLVLMLVYAFGLMFVFTKDIFAELEKFALEIAAWRKQRAEAGAQRAEIRRLAAEEAERERARRRAGFDPAPGPSLFPAPVKPGRPGEPPDAAKAGVGAPDEPPAKTATDIGAFVDDDDLPPVDDPEAPPQPFEIIRGAAPVTPAAPGGLAIVKAEETKKAKSSAVPTSEADYKYPLITLLKEQPRTDDFGTDDEYAHNMAALIRIIGEFGITVTPGQIHVGPVITCYEVVPAPGVRVEKIANLDKNIALHMSAQAVRILAPIPGKAAIGIEMPNKIPAPVGMRDILESEDWAGSKFEIPIALGKDVSGRPLISDLTRMPHLLIAGATGSGKSVCINSIIASIVYRKSPKDVRLIMVDPKVVELKVFNALPHMLIPVVTEPKKVPAALKWLLAEMKLRYDIFGKVGVRNIGGFNRRKKTGKTDFPIAGQPLNAPAAASDPADPNAAPTENQQAELDGILPPEDDIEIPGHLPYIVAIIDELADLMMVAQAEVETSIARLAQLARAAGIHLIIATQRPSVNVITGIIKANLPSRIAFQVASNVDSRTILDGKGAETLIGRGDMLFLPPGSSRLVRAQGAFVSDEEVQAFVDYLGKENGPPQYAQEVQDQIDIDPDAEDSDDDIPGGDDLGDDEELFKRAFEIIRTTRRASTSTLQRKLRIGYNRAARIMDLMEDKGIVGPENGSNPREILIDLD